MHSSERSVIQRSACGLDVRQVGALLRGEPQFLRAWSESWDATGWRSALGVIFTGAGLYGAAMGWWRAPLAGLFVALKFPLIILLTATGNALLNAMLAPLLGLNISLRQSFLTVLMSFTVASAILGAFSPLVAFMVWNAPPMTRRPGRSVGTYSFIQLTHVAIIAFAGVAGNMRLVQLLRELSGNPRPRAGSCLRGWRATCSSAASFPGSCGPSLARPICRWSFSARRPFTATSTKPSSAPCALSLLATH